MGLSKDAKSFTKITLDESEMPTQWYNIIPDLPSPPPPPLHPGTHQPVGPADLAPLFPMDLILQEVSTESYIDIPGEVLDVYRTWRPSPLFRARRLEQLLDTPARIYYKYEGVSPAGSHKTNTSVPQAYYNKKAGIKKITTETGAGQWGTALAFACALFDIECEVWQVGGSFDAKPYRRLMMEVFGATVHRHMLTNTVARANLKAAGLSFELQILRDFTNHREGEDNSPLAYSGLTRHNHMGFQHNIRAQHNLRAHNTERPDCGAGINLCAFFDNSAGVNRHYASALGRSSMAINSASAAISPSTVATPENFQILPPGLPRTVLTSMRRTSPGTTLRRNLQLSIDMK